MSPGVYYLWIQVISNNEYKDDDKFNVFVIFIGITRSVGNDASLIEICSEIEIIG